MAEPVDKLNRKIVDASTVAKEVDVLDAEIAELKAAYDQFFLGIERRPPSLKHQALKKRLLKVKGAFVRQTAIKFRINMVQQKFASYERLWSRTLQEIESGTYRRDLLRAKLQKKPEAPRGQVQELPSADDLAQSLEDALSEVEITAPEPAAPPRPLPGAKPGTPGPLPAVARPGTPGPTAAVARPAAAVTRPVGTPAAAPGAPLRVTPGAVPAAARAAAGTPPPPPGGATPLSDTKLRAVFDAYVTAKKRCQEDTSKLSYEQVAANLRKQVPELMKKSGAASVEFKIVIKDGKAVLRAIPK